MYSIKFLILIISISFILPSCSNFVDTTRKSLLGSEEPRVKPKDAKWVSKDQYDDLMDKYKTLTDKYEKIKDDKINSNTDYAEAAQIAASGVPSESVVETVDAFGDQESPVQIEVSGEGISKDLEFYKKAVALKSNGRVDEALKTFQYLEGSKVRQIKVRAKKNVGDIYFAKGQYDLALQVYEGIIRGGAFSGVVIEALENAVQCGAKLGLMDKKERYESILRDFFEIRV